MAKDEEANAISNADSSHDNAVDRTNANLKGIKPKKRKHETAPNEDLEIDLSLPEPPSKKAARKAKKQKTQQPEPKETTKPSTSNSGPAVTPPPSTTHPEEAPNRSRPIRSLFAIWIGNLPYHATASSLRTFITTRAPSISSGQITRIHMPAPDAPSHRTYKQGQKPANKGFAYVDFDGLDALEAAVKLSEVEFEEGGRKVLVKNAMDFRGRPERGAGAGAALGLGLDKVNVQKPPSKRVFVGNLRFDATKEVLEEHYGRCGEVLDVHMATFEDSGKCKGFAWVTFAEREAAEAAVKGFVLQEQDRDGEGAKQKKPRKWFVNRLHGRDLRVEFAEDAGFRYRKRFGSETRSKKYSDERRMDEEDIQAEEENPLKAKGTANGETSHDRRRIMRKAGKQSLKPDVLQTDSAKADGAIVEGKGTKVIFN